MKWIIGSVWVERWDARFIFLRRISLTTLVPFYIGRANPAG